MNRTNFVGKPRYRIPYKLAKFSNTNLLSHSFPRKHDSPAAPSYVSLSKRQTSHSRTRRQRAFQRKSRTDFIQFTFPPGMRANWCRLFKLSRKKMAVNSNEIAVSAGRVDSNVGKCRGRLVAPRSRIHPIRVCHRASAQVFPDRMERRRRGRRRVRSKRVWNGAESWLKQRSAVARSPSMENPTSYSRR